MLGIHCAGLRGPAGRWPPVEEFGEGLVVGAGARRGPGRPRSSRVREAAVRIVSQVRRRGERPAAATAPRERPGLRRDAARLPLATRWAIAFWLGGAQQGGGWNQQPISTLRASRGVATCWWSVGRAHSYWSEPYCWSLVGEGAVRVLVGRVYLVSFRLLSISTYLAATDDSAAS